MTRGIESAGRMHASTWLSNVKVGDRKEGSADAASRERDGGSRATFPHDYAYAKHPHGIPAVELERNPLIPMPLRAFMLRLPAHHPRTASAVSRGLPALWQRRGGAAVVCVAYGLFQTSEEESAFASRERKRQKKEVHGISMLTNHKNLAEPRTWQGTFGSNGELVCFFRASPRNVLRGLMNGTASSSDVTPMSLPK